MSFDSIRLDIDPVITCPYNKHHQIARSRIQNHIVKCEKQYPPGFKQQCPYDATHRVFESELVEHVENCPMKFHNPITNLGRSYVEAVPPIDTELESNADTNNDMWDEGSSLYSTNPFNEPTQGPMPVRHSSTSVRGNALIASRYSSKLRRPFGLSESLMLDISTEIEDDLESLSSERGVGRGQVLLESPRTPSSRGARAVRGLYKRGVSRGRLLH